MRVGRARYRHPFHHRGESGHRGFYEREGYHTIPLFGHYIGSPISVCYERTLSPSAAT